MQQPNNPARGGEFVSHACAPNAQVQGRPLGMAEASSGGGVPCNAQLGRAKGQHEVVDALYGAGVVLLTLEATHFKPKMQISKMVSGPPIKAR